MQSNNLKLSCLINSAFRKYNRSWMYRIPEKQTGSQTGVSDSVVLKVVFIWVCKPFCLLSIKLKYLGFFYHFSICLLLFYIFKSWILSYHEFMLSKGKNMEEMCVYNHAIHTIIYFTLLFYPYMQILFIRQISLQGDKNVAFDFWDAWLFGQPVYNYFDTQDFLSFASDFISTCESLRNVYEKLSKVRVLTIMSSNRQNCW